MNAAFARPNPRLTRRGWLTIVAVMVGQVLLAFLIGDRSPLKVRTTDAEPHVFLPATENTALGALQNPTLFAWEHPHGFSAHAWLQVTPPAHRSLSYTEPPGFLALRPEDLTLMAALLNPREADASQPATARSLPPVRLPVDVLAQTSLPTRSRLAFAPELMARAPSKLPELSSWPHSDALPPTLVRLLVDAQGQVTSALVISSSGLPAADAEAMAAARTLRFASSSNLPPWRLTGPTAPLLAGEVQFHWHVVPEPAKPAS